MATLSGPTETTSSRIDLDRTGDAGLWLDRTYDPDSLKLDGTKLGCISGTEMATFNPLTTYRFCLCGCVFANTA